MNKTAKAILLVEDNEDDVFLMERALDTAGIANPLNVVDDGRQALDYLSGQGKYADRSEFPIPAIVFLDLKLPLVRGHDVLAWIRQQPDLDHLIVVVLTSSLEREKRPTDVQDSVNGAEMLGTEVEGALVDI